MMQKMENKNGLGLCCEEFCSNKPTHFEKKNLYGLSCLLVFCQKHKEQYEDAEFENLRMRRVVRDVPLREISYNPRKSSTYERF